MKRVVISLLLLMSIGLSLAESACDLDVTLLNQDPYPAVPGDYVKLVFQIEGLGNPNCDDVTFNLLKNYPIEFDPGETGLRTFKKIDYIKDYLSNIQIPYKVRVNKEALDGTNQVEIRVQNKFSAPLSKTFDLEVEDVKADFEVYVKEYDYASKELTIEVLNIEESDIEALTIEIPKQEGITIKGSNRVVVGDLDSNEYTSADFEATPKNGDIKINLIYSDSINVRRTVEKTINFDSSYFIQRVGDENKIGIGTFIFWGVVILIIGFIIYKKIKKKKKK